ncbi:MAG: DUF1285 domain-containing protein [Hydrotalea sp.]|nr:DUF1285 domain-containing protein [Hydrotalea sp.]
MATNQPPPKPPRQSIGDMMRQGRGLWETGSKLKLPALCGDFTIRINKKGQWFYQNSPIGRLQLCQLFAVCLVREGGEYFLATPAEKGKIEVEDLPFYGLLADITPNLIMVKSSLDFWVTIDRDHPLTVTHGHDGQPRPVVRVRDNLDMLLSPAVFYDLANSALNNINNKANGENPVAQQKLFVESCGEKFYLA